MRPSGHRPSRRLTAGRAAPAALDVALELFAERGYRATTMDDIAEAAGVTKPLVYQHFSSKRALYLELVDSVAHELLAAVDRPPPRPTGPASRSSTGFAAYFQLVVTHEAAFRLLFGRDDADDEELGEALRRVEDAIAEAIDPLIDAGLDDEHRRLLAYAVVGMAEGASRHWIGHTRPRPSGTAAPTVAEARPSGWPAAGRPGVGRACARSTPTDRPSPASQARDQLLAELPQLGGAGDVGRRRRRRPGRPRPRVVQRRRGRARGRRTRSASGPAVAGGGRGTGGAGWRSGRRRRGGDAARKRTWSASMATTRSARRGRRRRAGGCGGGQRPVAELADPGERRPGATGSMG